MSGGTASARSKALVQEAIERLNYRPTQGPRAAEPSEACSLALVVTDLVNPYYTTLCAGAEAEAARLGYTLQVYSLTAGRLNVLFRLLEHRHDGAILVGGFI